MIKYSFILLGVYFLYYAGNIVYDLFLKKEKTVQTDITEEFSLGDFAKMDTQSPTQIGIEDVENVNTPKSFLKTEFQSKNVAIEDKPELDDLRKRFEAEKDIDDISQTNIQSEEASDKDNFFSFEKTKKDKEVFSNNNVETGRKKTDWKSLLKLSETTVHMVANYDGYKVYHSTM